MNRIARLNSLVKSLARVVKDMSVSQDKGEMNDLEIEKDRLCNEMNGTIEQIREGI